MLATAPPGERSAKQPGTASTLHKRRDTHGAYDPSKGLGTPATLCTCSGEAAARKHGIPWFVLAEPPPPKKGFLGEEAPQLPEGRPCDSQSAGGKAKFRERLWLGPKHIAQGGRDAQGGFHGGGPGKGDRGRADARQHPRGGGSRCRSASPHI
jgi:hypothetical protein